jgi:hypothetical protein
MDYFKSRKFTWLSCFFLCLFLVAGFQPAYSTEEEVDLSDKIEDFTNKDSNASYSGAAVADMILWYLDTNGTGTNYDLNDTASQPASEDRQDTLISSNLVDNIDDNVTLSDMQAILTAYTDSDVYDFGTTIDENSQWTATDAEDQDKVNEFIMHWFNYKVPGADFEQVPVAVVTSSNPAAASAKADFSHWMCITGYSADADPNVTAWTFPTVTLNGFYVKDPANSGGLATDTGEGLGNFYMTATTWNDEYFKPLATGLEGAGMYGAVVEPPDPSDEAAWEYDESPAVPEPEVKTTLENSNVTYKYTSYGSSASDDQAELKERLLASTEFSKMLESDMYNEAFNKNDIGRVTRVERDGNDYAVVFFEKEKNGKVVTTAAAIVSLEDGTFEMGAAASDAKTYFDELTRSEAYANVFLETNGKQPISIWPSLSQTNPLNYGQKVVTSESSGMVRETCIYQAEKNGEVELEGKSPEINLLAADLEYAWHNWRYSVAKKSWYRTSESKEPGFYSHYEVEVTGDEGVDDVVLPDSAESVTKDSVDNGYIVEFDSKETGWKKVTATDHNYQGSIYGGGISMMYFK